MKNGVANGNGVCPISFFREQCEKSKSAPPPSEMAALYEKVFKQLLEDVEDDEDELANGTTGH